VRISDKPDDVRMFANDKLHNTSGAIQLAEGPKHMCGPVGKLCCATSHDALFLS
jgi:hypothetical protein